MRLYLLTWTLGALVGVGCSGIDEQHHHQASPAHIFKQTTPSDAQRFAQAQLHKVSPAQVLIAAQAELARSVDMKRALSEVHAANMSEQVKRAGGGRRLLEEKQREITDELKRYEGQIASPSIRQRLQARLTLVQALIASTVVCNKPTLWRQEEFLDVMDSFATFPSLEADLVDSLTPGTNVYLGGCDFGKKVGKIELTLSKSGDKPPLTIVDWTDDSIVVNFPFGFMGAQDQPAQLRVTDVNNVVSDPLDVDFIASRAFIFIDTAAHQDLVTVNSECFTAATRDECGGIIAGQNGSDFTESFYGTHYKQCCSSVSSTDRYFVTLKNGWALADNSQIAADPFFSTGFRTLGFSDAFQQIRPEEIGGWTSCTFFNTKGEVTAASSHVISIGSAVAEVDVSWWVDWACSGISYAGGLIIYGPANVPYW
jgi:hypothetical protein